MLIALENNIAEVMGKEHLFPIKAFAPLLACVIRGLFFCPETAIFAAEEPQ